MADEHHDLLMKIVNAGSPMAAEGATQFVGSDTLRSDFTTGHIFELRNFRFAVGSAASLHAHNMKRKVEAIAGEQEPAGQAQVVAAVNDETKGEKTEFIDIQPVEFTRVFDVASTALFTLLVASTTIDSISIIKRKAAGARSAGSVFLRVDYNKVLLTDLKWSDSDERVIETGTFIFRELTLRYRPQRADGSLGPVIPATWKMK